MHTRAALLILFLAPVCASTQTFADPPSFMQNTTFHVQHISVRSSRSFEATVAAFEAQLGRYDPAGAKFPKGASAGELAQARERIAAMAGKSGFMLFDTIRQHGLLLPLVGQPVGKANQYTIGNPLIAVEMTQHNLAAGLYAPLRVLIYQDAKELTRIDYDLPSSLFSQFDDERITAIGRTLDEKMESLVKAAIQ
jgi:uncharacterized protein (DUF302 family)